MAKIPSKRGGGRGGAPKSPGTKAAPRGARSGARKEGGKQRGNLPGWLPDPGLARAMGARDTGAPKRDAAAAPARRGASRSPAHDPHAEREASRYERPIASREMILQVLAASDGPMDADALAQKLALTEPDRFDALNKRLAAMLREGQLLMNRKGAFAPAERMDLIPGVVIANPDGFGFLRPDAGSGKHDDLFLPPFEMRKVMHGDRVLASVTGVDRRGRSEGTIV
jgi:ribonuclease R